MSTAIRTPAAIPAGTGFHRQLGLFDATMLIAGTMIGSGIFIVSADIARDVGSSGWLLAIWVVTGVMTIMGALSYAELAGLMPQAGGQYVFLREAYSPLWGFLYGWTVFLIIQTGSIAAVGVAFAKFLGVLVPVLGIGDEAMMFRPEFAEPSPGYFVRKAFETESPVLFKVEFSRPLQLSLPLPWVQNPLKVLERKEFKIVSGQIIAVVLIALLTTLNCRGVREGKWVQNSFTVAKTLALIVLIALGLTVAANPSAIAANSANAWDGIYATNRFNDVAKQVNAPLLVIAIMVAGGAMVGALFSADAWNNVTFTAAEIKEPRWTVPWSLVLGTGLVIVLYLLANVAYLTALPVQGDPGGQTPYERGIAHASDDRVATAVLAQVSPRLGVPFIAIAVMISTFGCINGMILMGARLYFAMARDGLFFQSVGTLSDRGVPAVGLLLQGAWAILLVFSGTYSELLDFVIFAALLFYVLTVIGLFVLRRKWPTAERPVRAFGYPVIPALYVLLCAVVMLDLLIVRPEYTWPGLILVLTGIPVYFIWRGRFRAATA